VGIVGELGVLLDVGAGSAQSVEDGVEVGTLLHRDDTQLVLFIDPHEEGLVVVVENTSALRPVSVQPTCLQEPITLPTKEVNTRSDDLTYLKRKWSSMSLF
jgi:hypothetical protein